MESQDVIRLLHNSASDTGDQAPSFELAWGLCCTHGTQVQSVHLNYTDLLITIMNHQSHRLTLNTIFIHPWRSNEDRLSAFLNQPLGVTPARITLPSLNRISWDYNGLGLGLKNK